MYDANLASTVHWQHKSRKVYMLFELEPSRDVTGGAFYTEQEFDVEFISVLKHQSLHFILKQVSYIHFTSTSHFNGFYDKEIFLFSIFLLNSREISSNIPSEVCVLGLFILVD